MDVGFEALPDHADGVANAVLRIDHEFMRQNVEDFAVCWKRDVAGRIDGAAHIVALDVARAIAQLTPPRLLTPRTWPPATPITADSTGTLATPSASSTARRIELTVESRLTIRPLRRPLDSAAPSARNLTCSPSTSAINAHVFVLPTSSPMM